jgi:3-oxoacyl-[acyl-carrier-protein] synthase II
MYRKSSIARKVQEKMEKRRIQPTGMKAVVVSCDMVTAYGKGTDACWEGISAGKTAITKLNRFPTRAFISDCAATLSGLSYHQGESLVMQLLRYLFDGNHQSFPQDARLVLATTKGEIDFLEKGILEGTGDSSRSNPRELLKMIAGMAGVDDEGTIISAACASSSSAVARAAAMIRSGVAECVMVVACDSVTEFVFSGFSSLMALDKVAARPFDRKRSGLSLGEAAAYIVLMSETRALREGRETIGEIAGWGMSNDANHMTGPSRDGEGMALAIRKALKSADADEQQIGFISAHGTGTVFNDAMEIKAFSSVFRKKIPVYSIKGGTGHTMGATGLVETIIALRALEERYIPYTVGLQDPHDEFREWVMTRPHKVFPNDMALLTNAGFSGINAALVLARGQAA